MSKQQLRVFSSVEPLGRGSAWRARRAAKKTPKRGRRKASSMGRAEGVPETEGLKDEGLRSRLSVSGSARTMSEKISWGA
jgi:hypothetical protein